MGDIVVFGTTHVEIITRIQNNWIADDGFCSIGAGRGRSPGNDEGDGSEKCDSLIDFSFGTRELDNDNNSYYYL